MEAKLTYDEIDELMHMAALERDYAGYTARHAQDRTERDRAYHRHANACFLVDKLLDIRGPEQRRPRDYLLSGAEPYCFEALVADAAAKDVVDLKRYRLATHA